MLIDGSDSTIASQALAAANGLALSRSLEELMRRAGLRRACRSGRTRCMLFNPDTRSANLLIPGLVAILLTFSGTLLAAFAIVRERERGTLEQLLVTPVSPLGGGARQARALPRPRLRPAAAHPRPDDHRSSACRSTAASLLLLALSIVYLFALLSLGLLISSRAKTQMEAIQMAQMFLLPSIMLSGYIFPLSSLPAPLRAWSRRSCRRPTSSRSRAASSCAAPTSRDLWEHVAALAAIALVLVRASSRAFRKTIS